MKCRYCGKKIVFLDIMVWEREVYCSEECQANDCCTSSLSSSLKKQAIEFQIQDA